MKLIKLNFTGQIGNNIITVETDTEFLLGLSNGDPSAQVCLFDEGTEIESEEEKIGPYTIFKMTAPGTPCTKNILGTCISSNCEYRVTMKIIMRCVESSIAYRHYLKRIKPEPQPEPTPEPEPVKPIDIVSSVGPSSTDDEVASARCLYKEICRLESLIDSSPTISKFAEFLDMANLRIKFYAVPEEKYTTYSPDDEEDEE